MIPRSEQFTLDDSIWSVTELNAYVKELIDLDYRLSDLQVLGEVSNYTHAKSGHLYFTLKDDQSQIRCVMWRSFAERSIVALADGDAVLAHGRVSVYEAHGQYQLYVEYLEPAGRGDLTAAFERLKESLAAEGLFDAVFKKPIPSFPTKIGIVTSSEAAALRDIQNVLRRRWPLLSILVAPALVQGGEAPTQIIQSLQWLDGRNDIDTIIVARGGGSIEDLWAFNDEGVARAIFHADHPIIVGVGHETDFTIADFVADLRAPTPSAAAELAVPDRADMLEHIRRQQLDLVQNATNFVNYHQTYLKGLLRSLNNLSPQATLDSNRQRVDWLVFRLDLSVSRYLETLDARLKVAVTALEAVSPVSTLARGYAIVRKARGPIVRSVSEVESGDSLQIHVADGDFEANVD
jgi:exodeoxyribonuclease VII large subunit